MAQAVNLSAMLQIQGVTGIQNALNQVKSAFSSTAIDVNIRVSPSSLKNLDELNARILTLRNNLVSIQSSVGAATGSIGNFGQGITASSGGINRFSSSINAAQSTVARMREEIQHGSTAMEQFGTITGLAGRRFVAFSLAAGGIIALIQGLRTGVGAALDFQQSMVKLAQVSGETPDKLRDIQTEVTRLSTSLGTASNELINVAVVLKQAGLTAIQTKQALVAIAEASLAPNFGSMNEIVEGSIAIFRQFDNNVENLRGHLGSLNAVAAEFAVEGRDLVEVIRRSGGAFRQTGGELNELIGLFTAVRSTTRESAESISTGLRTIFTRIQRPQTVEALRELNVQLRYTTQEATNLGQTNLTDQFVGAYEAIRRVSEGLSSIRSTDPRFSAIIEELGGYRQISRVIPLIREFGEAQRAVNVAQAGSVSLQASTERAQESLLNRTSRVKEQFLELFRTIGDSSGFQSFARNALGVASSIAKILEVASPLIPILTTIATIKFAEGAFSLFGRAANVAVYGTPKVVGRASGGIIPGSGNGDTVPAMLTPGEFVIRKESAQKFGYDRLAAINARGYASGGRVQHYAGGGRVQYFSRGSDGPVKEIQEAVKLNAVDPQFYPVIENTLRQLGLTITGTLKEALKITQGSMKNVLADVEAVVIPATGTGKTKRPSSVVGLNFGPLAQQEMRKLAGVVSGETPYQEDSGAYTFGNSRKTSKSKGASQETDINIIKSFLSKFGPEVAGRTDEQKAVYAKFDDKENISYVNNIVRNTIAKKGSVGRRASQAGYVDEFVGVARLAQLLEEDFAAGKDTPVKELGGKIATTTLGRISTFRRTAEGRSSTVDVSAFNAAKGPTDGINLNQFVPIAELTGQELNSVARGLTGTKKAAKTEEVLAKLAVQQQAAEEKKTDQILKSIQDSKVTDNPVIKPLVQKSSSPPSDFLLKLRAKKQLVQQEIDKGTSYEQALATLVPDVPKPFPPGPAGYDPGQRPFGIVPPSTTLSPAQPVPNIERGIKGGLSPQEIYSTLNSQARQFSQLAKNIGGSNPYLRGYEAFLQKNIGGFAKGITENPVGLDLLKPLNSPSLQSQSQIPLRFFGDNIAKASDVSRNLPVRLGIPSDNLRTKEEIEEDNAKAQRLIISQIKRPSARILALEAYEESKKKSVSATLTPPVPAAPTPANIVSPLVPGSSPIFPSISKLPFSSGGGVPPTVPPTKATSPGGDEEFPYGYQDTIYGRLPLGPVQKDPKIPRSIRVLSRNPGFSEYKDIVAQSQAEQERFALLRQGRNAVGNNIGVGETQNGLPLIPGLPRFIPEKISGQGNVEQNNANLAFGSSALYAKVKELIQARVGIDSQEKIREYAKSAPVSDQQRIFLNQFVEKILPIQIKLGGSPIPDLATVLEPPVGLKRLPKAKNYARLLPPPAYSPGEGILGTERDVTVVKQPGLVSIPPGQEELSSPLRPIGVRSIDLRGRLSPLQENSLLPHVLMRKRGSGNPPLDITLPGAFPNFASVGNIDPKNKVSFLPNPNISNVYVPGPLESSYQKRARIKADIRLKADQDKVIPYGEDGKVLSFIGNKIGENEYLNGVPQLPGLPRLIGGSQRDADKYRENYKNPFRPDKSRKFQAEQQKDFDEYNRYHSGENFGSKNIFKQAAELITKRIGYDSPETISQYIETVPLQDRQKTALRNLVNQYSPGGDRFIGPVRLIGPPQYLSRQSQIDAAKTKGASIRDYRDSLIEGVQDPLKTRANLLGAVRTVSPLTPMERDKNIRREIDVAQTDLSKDDFRNTYRLGRNSYDNINRPVVPNDPRLVPGPKSQLQSINRAVPLFNLESGSGQLGSRNPNINSAFDLSPENVSRVTDTKLTKKQRREKIEAELARRAAAGITNLPAVDFRDQFAETAGLVNQRADRLYAQSIINRGGTGVDSAGIGASPISETTRAKLKSEALSKAEARTRKEFLSAESRAIQLSNPGRYINPTELGLLSEEAYGRVGRGEEKLIRDKQGRVLGSEASVAAATKATPDAKLGASSGVLFQNRFAERFDAFRDRLATSSGYFARGTNAFLGGGARALDFVQNGLAQTPGLGYAGYLAASQLSEGFNRNAGSVEGAAARGETGSVGDLFGSQYTRNKAIGSGIQSGLIGGILGSAGASFAVGSSAGPIGAVVGAILGAGYGIVSSLNETAKEITEAKLVKALTNLGDQIAILGRPGGERSDPGVGASALNNINTIRAEQRNRVEQSLRGTFAGIGLGASGRLTSSNSESYFAELRRNQRRDQAGQLPGYIQALNNFAEQTGRTGTNRSVNDLVTDFTNGGGGLNRELLRLVSELRGVSVQSALNDFKKVIEQARRAEQIRLDARRAEIGEAGGANTFNRLASNFQNASDSLSDLRTAFSSLSENGIQKVNLGGSALVPGANPNETARVLQTIATVGGEGGQRLRRVGVASSEIESVLPSLLSEISRTTQGQTEEAFGTALRSSLTRLFGGEEAIRARPEIGQGINTVVSQANILNRNGEIQHQIEVDVSALVRRLIDPFASAGRESSQRITSLLEAQANSLVEGLAKISDRVNQIGEIRDRAAGVGVSLERARAEIQGQQTGNERTAISSLPLNVLNGEFISRQERLLSASANTSPEEIGIRLRNVQSLIPGAALARENAFRENPNSDTARAAAENFNYLSNRAANLQRALDNLANASNQNAAIQERLNTIAQDRQARLSYAERFSTAGTEGRLEQNRGAALFIQAGLDPQSFRQFTPDQQSAAIQAGRSLGNIQAPAFGGRNVQDVTDELVRILQPGFTGLPQDTQEQERDLQRQLLRNLDNARTALLESARSQVQVVNTLSTNLQSQQQQFFASLNRFINQDRVTTLTNRQGTLNEEANRLNRGGAVQRLQQLVAGRAAAQGGEQLSDRDILAAQNLSGEFSRYFQARQVNQNLVNTAAVISNRSQTALGQGELFEGLSGRNSVISGGAFSNSFSPEAQERFERFLQQPEFQGTTEEQRQQIQSRFLENTYNLNAVDSESVTRRPNAPRSREIINEQFVNAVRSVLQPGGTDRNGNLLPTLANNNFRDLTQSSRNITNAGFNLPSDVNTPEQARAFLDTLNSFNQTTNRIERLPERIQNINNELTTIAGQLRVLRQNLLPAPQATLSAASTIGNLLSGNIFGAAGNLPGFAYGGLARGTDTVPAMLTPGEFVVNRDSAATNSALLQRINQARGPVYLADGGFADPREQARLYIERINRQRAIDERTVDRNRGARNAAIFGRNDGRREAVADPREAERLNRNAIAAQRRLEATAHLASIEAQQFFINEAARGVVENSDINGQLFAQATVNPFGNSGSYLAGQFAQQAYGNNANAFLENVNRQREIDQGIVNRNAAARNLAIFGRGGRSPELINLLGPLGNIPLDQPEPENRQRRERSPELIAMLGALGNIPLGPPLNRLQAVADPEAAERLNRNAVAAARRLRNTAGLATPEGQAEFLRIQNEQAQRFGEFIQQRNFDVGQASNLVERQLEAQSQNPFAAFGIGRADSGTQASISQGILSDIQRRRDRGRLGDFGNDGFGLSAPQQVPANRVLRRATGGTVPGTGFGDTVPALLTPGEYVLSRGNVQNLGGTGNVSRLANGGPIGNLAQGSGSGVSAELISAINTFGSSSNNLVTGFEKFSTSAQSLTQALTNFPAKMEVTGRQTVEVIFNGAEVFSKIQPELMTMVEAKTKEMINKVFKDNLPEANVNLE